MSSSPETLTSASILSSRRRRAMVACTHCRKRKIKCITSEEPPRSPCSRCKKRNLECEYISVLEEEGSSSSKTTPESFSSMLPASPTYGYPGPPSPPYYPQTALPQPSAGDYSGHPATYGAHHPSSISYHGGDLYNGMPAYPQYQPGQLFAQDMYAQAQSPYHHGQYAPQHRCSCPRPGLCYCGATRR